MSRLSQLWNAANELGAEVQSWLTSRAEKQVFLKFSRVDQIRLLKLRTWRFRYYLPVSEILDMIVPVLRSRIKNKKRVSALGVPVLTLTGHGAERILQEEIKKRYPASEHIEAWKDRERDSQLEAEQNEGDDLPAASGSSLGILQANSPEAFVEAYKRRITNYREEQRIQMLQEFRKKPYRANPWI